MPGLEPGILEHALKSNITKLKLLTNLNCPQFCNDYTSGYSGTRNDCLTCTPRHEIEKVFFNETNALKLIKFIVFESTD